MSILSSLILFAIYRGFWNTIVDEKGDRRLEGLALAKPIDKFKVTDLIMSQWMRFPTNWYVRPAKPQTSLCIRAVWSEPLLVAWVFYDCKVTDWTPLGVSKLMRRRQRLILVYTCQNVTLFEITCHGSLMIMDWKSNQ